MKKNRLSGQMNKNMTQLHSVTKKPTSYTVKEVKLK